MRSMSASNIPVVVAMVAWCLGTIPHASSWTLSTHLTSQRRSSVDENALYLVPKQGSQLVAAWNAATVQVQSGSSSSSSSSNSYSRSHNQATMEDHDNGHHHFHYHDTTEEDDNNIEHKITELVRGHAAAATSTTALAAARVWAARLFALPSSLLFHPHRSSHEIMATGAITSSSSSLFATADNDDVVLFPIVGFAMVQDRPDHWRAVPAVSQAACRLPLQRPCQTLYGWYSASCMIQYDPVTECVAIPDSNTSTATTTTTTALSNTSPANHASTNRMPSPLESVP